MSVAMLASPAASQTMPRMASSARRMNSPQGESQKPGPSRPGSTQRHKPTEKLLTRHAEHFGVDHMDGLGARLALAIDQILRTTLGAAQALRQIERRLVGPDRPNNCSENARMFRRTI